MEIRGTDDVPSKVMMTTDSLFTITRGESMSKNLTADMERFIDNFNSKRRMRHCSQQRVADELSELSGQTFSQRFISRLESKSITAERFAKIRPLFDKWVRDEEIPPTNCVEASNEKCTDVQKNESVLHSSEP